MRPTGPQEFFSFLQARSAEIISAPDLRRKLKRRRKVRVKLGIDPTAPDLHLGHIVPLRLLRSFQDAGHKAVLILGDFTGRIGDPSGQTSARHQLTAAEIRRNERTYLAQAGRVLNLKKAEIRHNSEWHGRMRLEDFFNLLAQFSLKSAWEREDFQKRLKAGKEVRLHEAMYHVLQAYDSVAVRSDVEIGSWDQKLNLLAGRELQKKLGQPPQEIVLTPYLIGLDGRQKMSKSFGNTINLNDSASNMFGKVMSIPDGLILNYAELAAWWPPPQVRRMSRNLERGQNPRDAKLDVAEALAALYHGGARARQVREEFLQLFSKKETPASIPRVRFKNRSYHSVELLLKLKAAASKSEARRLVRGGALEVDGRIIRPFETGVAIHSGSTIRVGKKKFFRAA